MHLAIVLVVAIILCFTYSKLFPKKHASVAKLPSPSKHPIFGHLPALLDGENLSYYLEHWACELGELYHLDLPLSAVVVVSSPLEILKMLKERPSHYNRLSASKIALKDMGVDGVLLQEGMEWKHSRKLITPAFTTSKLKQMSKTVIKHVLELRRDLLAVADAQEKLVTKPVRPSDLNDCTSLFGKLTFAVILETAFGAADNLMTPEYSAKGKIALEVINERVDQVLPLHKIYRTKRDCILEDFFKQMDDFVEDLILEYQNGSNRSEGTIFETLMLEHDGSDSSVALLKGNMKTLLIGGFETTSNSIQSMVRLLIENPSVLSQVHAEVDQVLGSNPTEADFYSHTVEDFPYCQNVVKEVVRLYPAFSIIGLESTQPVEVAGVPFSKGTEFFLILRSALFRDNYPTPNPLDFNPDRWNGLDDKVYRLQTNLSMGFGAGPRVCLGRALASVEMIYALAYAISAFDLKLLPRLPCSPSPVEVQSFSNWHKNFYPRFLHRTK